MEERLTIYEGINTALLALIPPSAVRILDVGCGTGDLGKCLLGDPNRYVVGITYSKEEAAIAGSRLSQVICAELNTFDFSPLGQFDCVILSHVLEHLYSPSLVLERLKCVLGPESVIIVALPNVVFWKQRVQFLMGRWRYRDMGILDRTHFRFFDKKSAEQLLEDSGYEILRKRFDGPFPLIKPVRHLIGRWAERIDRLTSTCAPGLLAFQFAYVARVRSDHRGSRVQGRDASTEQKQIVS
jgi:SAM-dependent methyltransferase